MLFTTWKGIPVVDFVVRVVAIGVILVTAACKCQQLRLIMSHA